MAAVRRYDILDTPPDGAFDRITALAARLLATPIAIVSIVDTDRVWFKSHHGLDVTQVGRDPGLCASAILQAQPWIVADAATDPRTLSNPLVAGAMGLRFYAGVPLATRDGYNLGTLCVIDTQPRQVTNDGLATLRDLAAIVMDELELRLAARETNPIDHELRRNAQRIARTLQAGLLPPRLPAVAGLSIAARYHVANSEQVGGDFYDVIPTESGCAIIVGDVCGKGVAAAVLTSTARWTLRAALTDRARTPAAALARLNQVWVAGYDDPEKCCTVALADVRPRAGGGADVTVALAGHPHPLLLRRDGERVERIGVTDVGIGWLPGGGFTDTAASLDAGDVLLVFTDGLLEALQHGSADDGRVRALLRAHRGASTEEVADAIDAELADRLRDDAAFLVVRVD